MEGRLKGYLSRRLFITRVKLFSKKINPFVGVLVHAQVVCTVSHRNRQGNNVCRQSRDEVHDLP